MAGHELGEVALGRELAELAKELRASPVRQRASRSGGMGSKGTRASQPFCVGEMNGHAHAGIEATPA